MLTVEDCLRLTRRQYPAGYGFALTFIEDEAGNNLPAILETTFACVRHAFRSKSRDKDSDIARFVNVWMNRPEKFTEYHPAHEWLIEAAQVLIQWGLDTSLPKKLRTQIETTLHDCGHPGY